MLLLPSHHQLWLCSYNIFWSSLFKTIGLQPSHPMLIILLYFFFFSRLYVYTPPYVHIQDHWGCSGFLRVSRSESRECCPTVHSSKKYHNPFFKSMNKWIITIMSLVALSQQNSMSAATTTTSWNGQLQSLVFKVKNLNSQYTNQ